MAASHEALIPLYGFSRGDTLGLLILARGQDRMSTLAEALQRSASVRVAPRARVAVLYRGARLPDTVTVEQAGMTPLDRFDVVPVEREEPR